jgi:hypothetical protein
VAEPDLGPGLDGLVVELGLQRLCGDASVQAVLAFGSRARVSGRVDSDLDLAVICRESSLDPVLKTERWSHYRGLLGPLGAVSAWWFRATPTLNGWRARVGM